MQVRVTIEKWIDLDELVAFIAKMKAFKEANPDDVIVVVFS